MLASRIFSTAAFHNKARVKRSPSTMRTVTVTDRRSRAQDPPMHTLARLGCKGGGMREPNAPLERF